LSRCTYNLILTRSFSDKSFGSFALFIDVNVVRLFLSNNVYRFFPFINPSISTLKQSRELQATRAYPHINLSCETFTSFQAGTRRSLTHRHDVNVMSRYCMMSTEQKSAIDPVYGLYFVWLVNQSITHVLKTVYTVNHTKRDILILTITLANINERIIAFLT